MPQRKPAWSSRDSIDEDNARRNAAEVQKYAECRENFLTGRRTANINVETWRKGEGSVPWSRYFEEWMADPSNRHAREKIEPVLAGLRSPGFAGLYAPFAEVERDPTVLGSWQRSQTDEERAGRRRFERACLEVARMIERRHPGVRLLVNRRPKRRPGEPDDDPAPSRVHARNRDLNTKKSADAEAALRDRGRAILRIMGEEKCSALAAIGLYRERIEEAGGKPPSQATCYRALAVAGWPI